MSKIKRPSWRAGLLLAVIAISATALTLSVTNLIRYQIDSNKTAEQIALVQEIAHNKNPDSKTTDFAEPNLAPGDSGLSALSFAELKNLNPDTTGWVEIAGTNIDYPFVQTSDNDFYLNHSFNRAENSAGWIFLDYRNDPKNLSKNTILYGHGRFDNTMFGSLKNILTSGWLNNPDNYYIRLSTESKNTLWQVFSAYKIPTTNDYIAVNFATDADFLNWANKLKSRSAYDFGLELSAADYVLTLSTCYNESEKVVLHAKLLKSAPRV